LIIITKLPRRILRENRKDDIIQEKVKLN